MKASLTFLPLEEFCQTKMFSILSSPPRPPPQKKTLDSDVMVIVAAYEITVVGSNPRQGVTLVFFYKLFRNKISIGLLF
jgi:hypothetical protein